MAFHGICACHGRDELWFGGVVCTNGSGSARQGKFAGLSDVEMVETRRKEQIAAAEMGEYSAMLQLGYSSAEVKNSADGRLRADLMTILAKVQPEVIYTHNLADKHPTHLSVVREVIAAARSLPANLRPRKMIGCEGWRDLDWLPDDDKVLMDVSGNDKLFRSLASCFSSQIEGGKRYDLAVEGRRSAQATFFDPHRADAAQRLIFGMDLTPLLEDESSDPADYLDALLAKFCQEARVAWRATV
jgi:LmbE family N-acetylglucosaminyl deacetylase